MGDHADQTTKKKTRSLILPGILHWMVILWQRMTNTDPNNSMYKMFYPEDMQYKTS